MTDLTNGSALKANKGITVSKVRSLKDSCGLFVICGKRGAVLESYRTVLHKASAEFSEKRSRFIGTAIPVTDEEQAVSFIAGMRSKYWDAKHNVYAYSLRQGRIQRCSDDGEPKGTAGVPVLEVLQKEALTDCALVVTRYFGGILLGTGGLIRAYSHGAKIAVAAAGIATMKQCVCCRMVCAYTQYGKAEALLKSHELVIRDTSFEADVTIVFLLPEERLGALEHQTADLFCGTVALEKMGMEFCAF